MLKLRVLERGRIRRTNDDALSGGTVHDRPIPSVLFDRLLRLEGGREDRGESTIFHWRRNEAIIGPWVGVLQVPGLQLEILPKLDDQNADVPSIRANVVEMLRVGGLIASRDRGEANLRHHRGTVHDQMIAGFLDRLLFELQRGLDRAYVPEEDGLAVVRGRIAVARNAARNAGLHHRVVCRYEVLQEDTVLNGTLRAACDLLARRELLAEHYPALNKAKVILADVKPKAGAHEAVHFTRQNERYRLVYEFARALLAGETPGIRGGEKPSFSLLFDMDKVFERYIAAVLSSRVVPQVPGLELRPQARGAHQFLFHQANDRKAGVLRMAPDLLFKLADSSPGSLVIDTKWKRLDAKKQVPPKDDLYQLYAYLHRYGCERAFFLMPEVAGANKQDFVTIDAGKERRVGVRLVNLNLPLHKPEGREALTTQLEAIVREGLSRVSLEAS